MRSLREEAWKKSFLWAIFLLGRQCPRAPCLASTSCAVSASVLPVSLELCQTWTPEGRVSRTTSGGGRKTSENLPSSSKCFRPRL